MADAGDHSGLVKYREMRDFSRTPEPFGSKAPEGNIFVVQKHAASHLHYDFRLRLHGALKSWALSKGPSLDPGQHRLASQTEDHPLEYASFEGIIPAGNYGAGTVLIWDQGTWEALDGGKGDYYRGRLRFTLHGERLKGNWVLARELDDPRKWILVKEEDEFATFEDPLLQETSVVTGRTLEEIAEEQDRVWTSDRGEVSPAKEFGHPPGGSLPAFIEPQAATLADQVPASDDWLHEIKYDGYRMVCRIDKSGSGIRFYSRKGYDFTARLPNLVRAVAILPMAQGWLDGEVVVLTPEGGSDFHALQEAVKRADDSEIAYLVFDLMNYEGFDIRSAPLSERKALLAELMPHAGKVRYADHVVGQGREFYRAACGQKLEGILSKQLDSEYLSQRTRSWVKVKCEQRQEFVVGGYTESGAGRPFGSLLAGYYDDDGRLVFVGKIKSGYSVSLCESLLQTMAPYRKADPPFVNPPSGEEYRNPTWLSPELVAEVAFSGISGSGLLRHASFKGMREDKPAREVRLERPEPPHEPPPAPSQPDPSPPPLSQRARGEQQPLRPSPLPLGEGARRAGEGDAQQESEPQSASPLSPPFTQRARGEQQPLRPSPLPLGEGARRAGEGDAQQESEPQSASPSPPPQTGSGEHLVKRKPVPVFPHERIGREEIVEYYRLVSDRMIPHLADRPLTLIMCRTNIYACSFKKHATNLPPPVKGVDAGHEERYIAIDSASGLETLVRLGVVEFHAWQSRYTDLEHPDRMLFDLDPPENQTLPWERLAEAALLLRIHLQEYGLESYLQTTGGKGYYLVLPLAPTATWGAMTGFAKRIAKEMEFKFPDRFTAQLEKEKRGGRIYVDWMRNGRGANAAEPYSLRARTGAPVSSPITWEELVAGVRPDSINLRNMAERIAGLVHDPWEGYFELRQKLPEEGVGPAGKGP